MNIAKVRSLAALSLLTLGAVCAVAAFNTAQATGRALSFEERVAHQRKIEQVYWRHRVSTQKEQAAQVPFLEAMPENAIRAKVEDTLRKSTALSHYWQRPVTAGQLQAEVARITSQTKQPEVLRELFAALDNDPSLIAECLARPLLVERQLANWYARDARFHGPLRNQIESDLTAHQGGQLKSLSGEYAEREFSRQAKSEGERRSQTKDGVRQTPIADSDWEALLSDYMLAFNDGTTTIPSSPFHDSSAANEAESSLPLSSVSMLREDNNEFYVLSVLSQSDDDLKVASVTWRKEPVDIWWNKVRGDMPMAEPDLQAGNFSLPQIAAPGGEESWQPTVSSLTPRENHTAVWTGTEMIVWGGFYNPSNYDNYAVTVGSRYNPATDSWSLTSTANAPLWRERHTAVWTGNEMIVWGGYSGAAGTLNTGARYNPATNVWTPTSLTNAPTKRSRHTAVWTGSRMLIFAGRTGDIDSTTVNTGSSYDPVSDSWIALSSSNAPAPREYHTAVWTGTEMIVWGGYDGTKSTGVTTGGRYNPQTNTWTATSTTGAPAARYGHKSVWTGTRMIVWGGQGPNFFTYDYLNTGAVYDPAANTWTATSLTGAPSPRSAHGAEWSGTEMIVWGGDSASTRLLNGARYNPATNSWRSLSTVGAPQCSVLMSTVWTGTEMIVWGGQEPTIAADINTGGRYNPQTDSWLPVTNPQNGGVRQEHPAVWTGAEMIVWGSYSPSVSPSNTGARYYPATDSWLPTSMVNVPLYRYAPLAVWTGSQMVVWGGCADSFCSNRLNTGGRYNPASNSWQATSTVGAAESRYWFSSVWTGTEMIVWGGCNAQTCGPGGSSDRDGLNNGGRYNPQTDTWQSVSTTGAPTGRWFQTADWTGTEMIVWGGINGFGPYNTGGKYNPSTNTWTATSTTGAPSVRGQARSVWTGSKLMVWGGYNSLNDSYPNTGGLYDPVANTWSATSTTGAPVGRNGHTMVWTGSEAIAWGGCNGVNCLTGQNTGGRYNPITNTWVATSLVEAPQPRDTHSAVWTGTEMIVFGGEPCGRCEPIMDTGGRYSLGGSQPPGDTVTISRAQYVTSKSQLTVNATDSDPTAVLTASVTSSGQVIGTMTNRGGGTYSGKFRVTPNPVNVTVTSNLGGSASAAVRVR